MKKLFSPRGSLLFITLPQALLAGALFCVYKSAELTPSLPLMIVFGVQALLVLFSTACAIMNKGGKAIRIVQLAGFIAIMSAAAPFLLAQFDFATSLSPEAIYGVLCLIPLIYIATAILYLGEIPLIKVKNRIIICVCVPLVFAIIPLLAIGGLFDNPFFDWVNDIDWLHSAASIILILLFALFFAFVCLVTSILYHYRTKKSADQDGEAQENHAVKPRSEGYYVFIAFLALVLPLLCLGLNEAFGGIAGDFSGWWFYILALMNGIAMLIPRKNKWVTLVTLFFKAAGFLYVIYFVVTMIRYAPLGVAFYAYFAPLLVLTPIALFAAELFQIIDDFRFLKQHFALNKISVVLACGMLALCAGFVLNGYAQKVNFDKALYYLGDIQEQPTVNVPMLKSSLRYMRRSDPFWGRIGNGASQNLEGAPILNEVYHRVIFGGKILQDDTYRHIQRIFLPEDATAWQQPPRVGLEAMETMESVKLHDINTETRFDEDSGAYKAWVHLTLKNETSEFNQEYAVKFTLPDGVFVSDYYLDVYGERKYGIVSEKNAAKSLYQSIVNRSRDPGIIYYESGNTLELRVFPFGAGETRETGFELMFLQSDSFTLGKHTIALEGEALAEPIVTGGTCFMPASYKANLETISVRTPKYYFVADIRRPLLDEEITLEQRLARISDYAQKHHIADVGVYLTCYNVRKTGLADLDSVGYGDGGFNLALAMDMIHDDAKKHPGSYPVIMVATGNLYNAAIAGNKRFTRDFPEVEHFYLINSAGALTPHRLADGRMDETASASPLAKRLSYNEFFFRDDGQSEVSYNNRAGFTDISYGGDAYINALLLHEKIEKAATEDQAVETVKDGISRRLLTRNNSFIVLETKEQEDELNRRNKEFLEGKTIGASAAAMSEPDILVALLLTLLLLGLLWMRRRRHLEGC